METNNKAKNADMLYELFQSVKNETVSIIEAVQAIKDAVSYIEESAYEAGHREGEKYASQINGVKPSAIYIP